MFELFSISSGFMGAWIVVLVTKVCGCMDC